MHCDLLPSAMSAAFRHTYETHHRFLITSSSALQISLFCFSLGRKSGPSSQDLPHNLCPPKYVFPLATCLHLEFSPGRKTVKSFQSFAAFLLTSRLFKGHHHECESPTDNEGARLYNNKQLSKISSHYLKLCFTGSFTERTSQYLSFKKKKKKMQKHFLLTCNVIQDNFLMHWKLCNTSRISCKNGRSLALAP